MPPLDDEYEVFEGSGFVMERRGRFMQSRSTLSPEEHAEMRRTLGESVPEIVGDMVKEVQELLQILHRYTPEAMISSMWLRNSPIFPGAAESEEQGEALSHGFVEYVAALYVRDHGSGRESIVRPDVLEDVQARVAGLFKSSMWLGIAKGVGRPGEERDARLEELRFITTRTHYSSDIPGSTNTLRRFCWASMANCGTTCASPSAGICRTLSRWRRPPLTCSRTE